MFYNAQSDQHNSKKNGSNSEDGKAHKPKPEIAIEFEQQDPVFIAGDKIKGRVCIKLPSEVRVRTITLKFNGYARAGWDEQRAYTKGSAPVVSRKNTDVFVDHSIVLLRTKKESASHQRRRLSSQPKAGGLCAPFLPSVNTEQDEGIVLSAGVHSYPFEYTLPGSLPSNFVGKWGQVRYYTKITLERPWKSHVEREHEFSVRSMVDLNDEPELVRPIGGATEFSTGFLCCMTGPVIAELKMRRRGYVCGETIPFRVDLENSNKRRLLDVKVALVQNVVFRVGDDWKRITNVVTALNKGGIDRGASLVWEGDSLLIPPHQQPTSDKSFRTVQIKYAVTLSVYYSNWRDAFTLPVPVVVGTVPLRRGTIQAYLNLLGASMSPTESPRLSLANALKANGSPKLTTQQRKLMKARQSLPCTSKPLPEQHGKRRSTGISIAPIRHRPSRQHSSESMQSSTSRDSQTTTGTSSPEDKPDFDFKKGKLKREKSRDRKISREDDSPSSPTKEVKPITRTGGSREKLRERLSQIELQIVEEGESVSESDTASKTAPSDQ